MSKRFNLDEVQFYHFFKKWIMLLVPTLRPFYLVLGSEDLLLCFFFPRSFVVLRITLKIAIYVDLILYKDEV